MLARRLPSILPPLSIEESLETIWIYSITGQQFFNDLIWDRPFRSPHHTTSDVALVGGGSIPVPGEISLGHNGVLFLDELPEFKRSITESLRQPLEERKILIARAKCSVQYPASFMLLAAMNPCLCGYVVHPTRKCTYSKNAIYWYRRRTSAPILERIDLHVEGEAPSLSDLVGSHEPRETSAEILARVLKARKIQDHRFNNDWCFFPNAMMSNRDLSNYCGQDEYALRFLLKQMDLFQLSVRSYCRILKVSRTVADLCGKEKIAMEHIAEAISFRTLDKPLKIQAPRPTLKTFHSNGTAY